MPDNQRPAELDEPETFARWVGEDIELRSPAGPCFRIQPDGSVVDLAPTSSEAMKQALGDGQVLGHSLHARHILALHGSASLGPAGAVAVLGFSGWGKSTMAGQLRRLGFGFLTDDVVAVHNLASAPTVAAGPAYARLWPDTANHLGLDPESYARVWDAFDKRKIPLVAAADRAPLSAIYVIDRDAPDVRLSPMTPSQAMVELVRHSFAFLLLRERPEAWHFEACSALAQRVPMLMVGIPAGLDNAAAAARLIAREEASPTRGGRRRNSGNT